MPARRVEVRFHDVASAPSRVQLDGRALRESGDPSADGYAYDAQSRTLVVRFAESGSLQRLVIRLR